MQRLEVSGAVRLLYGSLGVKGLSICRLPSTYLSSNPKHQTFLRFPTMHVKNYQNMLIKKMS